MYALSIIAKWFPLFYSLFIIFSSVFLFYRSNSLLRNAKKLFVISIASLLVYSEFLTLLQYRTWYQNDLTRLLLQLPLSSDIQFASVFNAIGGSSGYFFYYAFTRFWLGNIGSVIVSLVVLSMFVMLLKRFSSKSDPAVSWFLALGCIVSKWPGFVIFLGAFMVLSILGNLAYRFKKVDYFNFEIPYILALGLSIVLSSSLISFLGLNSLVL